ncbi:MAG: ribosomal-processing cysteine protease Prp, partial [Dorea sp.]|nr:ribosomal-processing cysteine protease Prp [Dorea sp.]
MIHVTIYRNKRKEYTGFKTYGHAGFSDEGQDIVCAAASVLIINTVNAIEKFTEDRTSLVSDDAEGVIDYSLKDKPSKEAKLLLDTMVLGLVEMSDDENYAEYIDLTFE